MERTRGWVGAISIKGDQSSSVAKAVHPFVEELTSVSRDFSIMSVVSPVLWMAVSTSTQTGPVGFSPLQYRLNQERHTSQQSGVALPFIW